MRIYVIERRAGERTFQAIAVHADGDEARRLADMWTDGNPGAAYRVVQYSETTKARALRGVWVVVSRAPLSAAWSGSEDAAHELLRQMQSGGRCPDARVAAFEPSLT